VQSFVTLMGGILTDRTDKAFAATGWVDADEVEHFSFVKVAFGAAQVTHSQLFDLIRFDTHV
jgi:hypothetical protein